MTTTTGTERRYLSRQAAANYLNVCRRTLDGLLASGRVPKCKLGRRCLVDKADLDRLMEQSKVSA